MKNLSKTLFISDLHLQESLPHITQQFCELLNHCDASIDALYILGDLFEAWIGDDDDNPLNHIIIQSLKNATQTGLPIYFLHGNRDFLIGQKFLQATGCQLLAEESKINLYGEFVLLLHGDILCTQDTAYLKWRKIARNPFLHTLFFLSLPLKLRRKFADKMRAKSAKYTQLAPQAILDVNQEAVEHIMQEHDVKLLIHGHTHRPAFHQMPSPSHAQRIVLGAWHQEASILIWDSTGRKKMVGLDYLTRA